MSSKAALGGPTFGTDYEKISTQNIGGLARRILETTEETTGVICVALDLEVAGTAVGRGKNADVHAAEFMARGGFLPEPKITTCLALQPDVNVPETARINDDHRRDIRQ
jgi:hypothetical protein